jgi:hypothetical protein
VRGLGSAEAKNGWYYSRPSWREMLSVEAELRAFAHYA